MKSLKALERFFNVRVAAKSVRLRRRLPVGERLTIWMLLVLAGVSVAAACNIPVFRYALERWRPDTCELIVYYDDELSEAQQRAFEKLNSNAADQGGQANAQIVRLSVKAAPNETPMDAERRSLLETLRKQSEVTFPYVVARTNVGGRQWINHWHGRLEDVGKARLFESPARKELQRRLLAGHSVVWLVLKSSDPKKTAAAKTMIKENLASLTGKIKLPEGVGLPGSELHSEVPLLVQFSLLEVDTDDPRERFLADLVKGFYPDAIESGDPLIVPVFGRGRALEVIPASQLDASLMDGLTQFLSGACSCQVKEQNPGFDLLISADWDTQLFGEDGQPPPPSKSIGPRDGSPQLLTIPPGRNR